MSRPIKKVLLSKSEEQALEKGWRTGSSHCYRQRCRLILLKASGQRSKEVAAQVGSCEVSVNSWVSRYLQQGISGLQTKAGRGRKPILTTEDEATVKAAVQQERQRLSQAKAIIEQELDKQFSTDALRRFLKVITGVTSVSANE